MSGILFRQRPVYSANHFLWLDASQPQAGVIDPQPLIERGSRVKKLFRVISTIVVVFAVVADVALFVWAVFSSM